MGDYLHVHTGYLNLRPAFIRPLNPSGQAEGSGLRGVAPALPPTFPRMMSNCQRQHYCLSGYMNACQQYVPPSRPDHHRWYNRIIARGIIPTATCTHRFLNFTVVLLYGVSQDAPRRLEHGHANFWSPLRASETRCLASCMASRPLQYAIRGCVAEPIPCSWLVIPGKCSVHAALVTNETTRTNAREKVRRNATGVKREAAMQHDLVGNCYMCRTGTDGIRVPPGCRADRGSPRGPEYIHKAPSWRPTHEPPMGRASHVNKAHGVSSSYSSYLPYIHLERL